LARADRAHQVEDLAALFALERRRVKVADDLRDGALDAEEFVGEEIEDLERLILEQALGARIVGVGERMQPGRDDQVVNARMRELGHDRVGFHDLEIFEQGAAPLFRLARSAVFFDHSLEVIEIRHRLSPSGSGYRVLSRNTAGGSVKRSGRTNSRAHSAFEYIGAVKLQQVSKLRASARTHWLSIAVHESQRAVDESYRM